MRYKFNRVKVFWSIEGPEVRRTVVTVNEID